MHSPLNEELVRDRIRTREREATAHRLAGEVWRNQRADTLRARRAEAGRRALGQALISLGTRISGPGRMPTPRPASK